MYKGDAEKAGRRGLTLVRKKYLEPARKVSHNSRRQSVRHQARGNIFSPSEIYSVLSNEMTFHEDTDPQMGATVSQFAFPNAMIEEAKLKEGDWLEIEAVSEGHVRLGRENDIPTLAELVAQITPENRYPEV